MIIKDEQGMLAAGKQLALELKGGMIVFLEGDLGAGKTTLVRGVLQGFGYKGAVKSPTYNLVEPYIINDQPIFHFDLYRVKDAEELEYMGVRDYFNNESICFVEWPANGGDLLTEPNLLIKINIYGTERELLISNNKDS